ncbi:CAP domain-containing protein [Aeromicrobium sp. 179-A 4D2 NHS]|uniref:CAP domain-containing protein n=1 Tax=Aeromicrobium sp. 179-A 4D2 NHS TaxID=3142375 RepID=UPI00399EFB47
MPRKLIALVTGLLTAALMLGVVSPATAAPKKVTPKVSLSTPKATVIQWSTSTFKGKVNTKKAVGAKVSVQRKTTKGWKDIKKGKVTKKRTYTLHFQTNSKNSLYRVKVHANKKIRIAYSRTVRVKTKPDPRDIPWTVERAQAQIVKDTNAFRVSQGLNPVTIDSRISKIAQDWSDHMARTRDFQHSKTYNDQIRALGYDFARENIAMGHSPDEVVAAWFASPGHRAAMLDPRVTHIGVGFTASGKYYTQNFGGFWPDEDIE